MKLSLLGYGKFIVKTTVRKKAYVKRVHRTELSEALWTGLNALKLFIGSGDQSRPYSCERKLPREQNSFLFCNCIFRENHSNN